VAVLLGFIPISFGPITNFGLTNRHQSWRLRGDKVQLNSIYMIVEYKAEVN